MMMREKKVALCCVYKYVVLYVGHSRGSNNVPSQSRQKCITDFAHTVPTYEKMEWWSKRGGVGKMT